MIHPADLIALRTLFAAHARDAAAAAHGHALAHLSGSELAAVSVVGFVVTGRDQIAGWLSIAARESHRLVASATTASGAVHVSERAAAEFAIDQLERLNRIDARGISNLAGRDKHPSPGRLLVLGVAERQVTAEYVLMARPAFSVTAPINPRISAPPGFLVWLLDVDRNTVLDPDLFGSLGRYQDRARAILAAEATKPNPREPGEALAAEFNGYALVSALRLGKKADALAAVWHHLRPPPAPAAPTCTSPRIPEPAQVTSCTASGTGR